MVIVGVLECQLARSLPPFTFEPIGKWVLNQQTSLCAMLLTKLVWRMQCVLATAVGLPTLSPTGLAYTPHHRNSMWMIARMNGSIERKVGVQFSKQKQGFGEITSSPESTISKNKIKDDLYLRSNLFSNNDLSYST